MDGDLFPGTQSLDGTFLEQEIASCFQILEIMCRIDVIIEGVVLIPLDLLHEVEDHLSSTLLIKVTLSH